MTETCFVVDNGNEKAMQVSDFTEKNYFMLLAAVTRTPESTSYKKRGGQEAYNLHLSKWILQRERRVLSSERSLKTR